MPIFTYTALRSGKDLINGRIEADSLKEARESLRKMDLVPTKIEEQTILLKDKKAKRKTARRVGLPGLSMRDKIDFTNTLYVLSKTGISLIESLLFIEINTSSKSVQKLSAELRRQVLSGSNLSEAVNKYPEIFDQIYSGLVRAGEESGELDTTLERLTYLLDKQDRLKNKIITTMMYPCFIVLLAAAVTTVMLAFVFPAFKDMYSQMGKDLPFITELFMNIGTFMKRFWIMIPIIFGTAIYGGYVALKWPVSRRIIDNFSLKIPVFKNFVKLASLSNFVSVLKVSFDAGVPILDSLMLANMTVRNYPIKDALKESTAKIQHGQSLSAALKTANVIPGIIMCMISTGEQSGQLGEMLGQAGLYIDVQLERVIDLLNRMMEPVLLIVIGGLVLLLALALYLPLFQSYSNMM